ncbi:MAG: CHAT domain-containing tetratricopeptide repeat protein, partial [Tepidisphaeraceae bacterium]
IYKGQDDTDVAGSLNDLATCLGFLGRNQEALDQCQAALDMLQRIHKGQDSAEVATALANVAQCLQALGRSGEALPDHEAALDMRRRIYVRQDHPEIAESLNNMAGCFTSLGRNADALASYQAALDMYQRIYKDQDHPDLATALSNTAVALDNVDRFADALQLHEQALEMSRRLYKDQDHPSVAMYLSLLAGCQISVGRPAEALPNSQAALEMQKRIYKERDHPIVAWSISVVGKCLRELGRKEEALAAYQSAMAMSERLSDPVSYNYSSKVGDILLSMGKSAEAAAAYDRSINAFEQARSELGGDEQDRMKFMDQNELDDFHSFDGMVRAQLALHRPDKAAEYLDRGRARSLLDLLERAERQSGGDLLSPIAARAEKTHDSRLLQEIKEAGTALAAADERVGQLISQINYARSINSADADAQIDELQPKLREACGQYASAHRRAVNLAGATTFAESTSAQQIQSFLKPGQHLLMYSIIDQAVIVIPPAGQAISAARLTDTDGKTPLSGAALIRPIWAYQKAIISHGQSFTRGARLANEEAATRPTDHMAQDGYDLFRRLMPAEVWRQIKDDDLVFVVPDWEMNGLPLETLIVRKPEKPDAKNNQYWLDEGPAICYGPSAAALLRLSRQQAGHPAKAFAHQAVLLGDPVLQRDATDSPSPTPPAVAQTRDASLGAYGPLSPLPGTRTEVAGIYKALTGRTYAGRHDDSVVVLLGEDATGPRLADAVAGTRYLHLATHGLAESGRDAIYSSVVLTQPRVVTSQDTGLLTLRDLIDHWGGKLDGTELVVLSACDSQGIDKGGTNAVTDEGVYGLPWGFWYAGSPAVVASLWEVQDSSTASLMQQFYRDLQSPDYKTKLAAFTAARKQLKQEYPEPFFWAPFIYLGNPN